MSSAMYGYTPSKEVYYKIPQCDFIVVPNTVDYKSNAIVAKIHENINVAELDIYNYHSDLETECNLERVAFMKEWFLAGSQEDVFTVNEDYVISVEFELYNNAGKLIKNGSTSIKSKYCNALINSPVQKDNSMEYRRGFVFDGRIEIAVPEISRYGIKSAFVQHPYTLRIKNIEVLTTVGNGFPDFDESTQMVDLGHASHAGQVNVKSPLCYNTFNSHFITNAKVGTTMIDQVVTPAVLETQPTYELVPLCSIDCTGAQYTVKMDNKLKSIILNVEVLLDNFNVVYDDNDIYELLHPEEEEPNETPGEVTPTPIPDDEKPEENPPEENPGDNTGDTDNGNGTDTPGDNTGDESNNEGDGEVKDPDNTEIPNPDETPNEGTEDNTGTEEGGASDSGENGETRNPSDSTEETIPPTTEDASTDGNEEETKTGPVDGTVTE